MIKDRSMADMEGIVLESITLLVTHELPKMPGSKS